MQYKVKISESRKEEKRKIMGNPDIFNNETVFYKNEKDSSFE
jgi:hypothetical protein